MSEFHLIEKRNNKYILLNGLYTIKIVDLNCEIDYSENIKELIGWKNLIKSESLEETRIAVKGIKILEEVLKEMEKFMEKVRPRTFEEKFEDDKRIEREEGREEGRKEGKLEIAKKLLLNTNNNLKTISLCTGLSTKKLLYLKKQLNIL